MSFTGSKLHRSIQSLPVVLTAAMLLGVGAIGFATGWRVPPASIVFGASAAAPEAWCRDHGVLEATCIICRGHKVTESPPSKRIKGAPVVAEPPVEGKPRAVIQVPSAEVLRVAGVQTGAVEVRSMVETVEANAESGYDMTRYAQVGARAPGFAALVRVKAGQKVKKGDVLCVVDSAEVGKAKAELLLAAASLASRRAALERIKSSTTAGFRNQADQLAAEAEVKEAGIRLFNARQALTSLGLPVPESMLQGVPNEQEVQFLGLPSDLVASLEPGRATANLLPVTAPLDGTIVSQAIVPGESVDLTRPLFVLADTSRMWVTAELPPAQAVRVRIGHELSFKPDGFEGAAIVGSVAWISTEVSEKTRTVQVRAEVPNPDGSLLARMFGRASITISTKASALAVPVAAVQDEGESHLVFVRLNDEVYRPRAVVPGKRAAGYVEILDGLKVGDIIATEGSYFLGAQANRGKLGAGCCANE